MVAWGLSDISGIINNAKLQFCNMKKKNGIINSVIIKWHINCSNLNKICHTCTKSRILFVTFWAVKHDELICMLFMCLSLSLIFFAAYLFTPKLCFALMIWEAICVSMSSELLFALEPKELEQLSTLSGNNVCMCYFVLALLMPPH